MKVVIVGGGPAGLLMAHYLVRRSNYQIHIYERRDDPRNAHHNGAAWRTFPIALQTRGLNAIRAIPGLEAAMEQVGLWAVGVCIHSGKSVRRITRPPNLNLDRNDIALVLLEQLVQTEPAPGTSVTLHYNCSIENFNLNAKTLTIQENDNKKQELVEFDQLVAADGSRSNIRQALGQLNEISFEQENIPDEYKSFYIARKSPDGSVVLDADKIHAWMVGTIRIITVPLQENSCNGAFVFNKGEDPFVNLKTAEQVQDYFRTILPDTIGKLVTDEEAKSIIDRPVSTLLSVKCDRLHVRDCVLLIGDAAHAVSASVGQGCNSALEDARIFAGYLEQYQDDWSKALPAYTTDRLPNAHALRELSDFTMPRTAFMRVEFILRSILRKLLPSWISKFIRPLPTEILSVTDMSYVDVLEQTKWWTNRVKRSLGK